MAPIETDEGHAVRPYLVAVFSVVFIKGEGRTDVFNLAGWDGEEEGEDIRRKGSKNVFLVFLLSSSFFKCSV